MRYTQLQGELERALESRPWQTLLELADSIERDRSTTDRGIQRLRKHGIVVRRPGNRPFNTYEYSLRR